MRAWPDRLLRASDLEDAGGEQEHAEWKPVVLDEATGEPAVPNGSVGHRYGEPGRWNLRLDGIEPALTLLDRAQERVASTCRASTSARARAAR